MTKVKSNALIAEFIGLSYCNKHNYEGWYTNSEHNYRICDYDGLKYHSNWSSLIPVVEKIESIEDEHRCAKYNVIIEQSWCEIVDNNNSDTISKGDTNNKIDAVYSAVVGFIQWYNKNN
jgi:hypothetical protein